MTDETKDRPGVKNAPDTRTYQARVAAMEARKGQANTERAVLENELGRELESFQRLQRDPDHQRLYREFFTVLRERVDSSGVDMQSAIRTLLAPPEPVKRPDLQQMVAELWSESFDRTLREVVMGKPQGAYSKASDDIHKAGAEPDPHKEAREQARAFIAASAPWWREAGAEPSAPDLIDALTRLVGALRWHAGPAAGPVVIEVGEAAMRALMDRCQSGVAWTSGEVGARLPEEARIETEAGPVWVKRRK